MTLKIGTAGLVVLLSVAATEASESKPPSPATLSERAEALTPGDVQRMQQAFGGNPRYRRAQNAIAVTPVDQLALDRSVVVSMEHTFSHKLDDWSATWQKKSGRCWLFAGTNLLRMGAMKRMNLKEFEFSQNYLFFWDKLERANYFLEAIIDTAGRPDGDRTVNFLLASPAGDGGQWNMFVNLVRKHGLVPKSAMPETESSSNSRNMNAILRAKLREGARHLRVLHAKGASAQELQSAKRDVLTVIHRILCIHLGTPPERFLWQWRDRDGTFHRDGVLTPRQFVQKYVTLDLDEYVCLVHDPRASSPAGRTFTVAYLGNVVGGEPVRYLNIGIDRMKAIARQTLLDGEPVWFGCDCGPQMSRELGLWDKSLFDYEGIYDTAFTLTKAERLVYHQSRMTHAMLFTGVDVVGGKVRRWRVENSWGTESGKDGFFSMNDSWFKEYMFEIAARKRYLPESLKAALDEEPIVLPPWDPMGALAETPECLPRDVIVPMPTNTPHFRR